MPLSASEPMLSQRPSSLARSEKPATLSSSASGLASARRRGRSGSRMLVISGVETNCSALACGLPDHIRRIRDVAGHVAARTHLDEGGADHCGCEHRVERAAAVELVDVVGAADMRLADEDLRHGAAAIGADHHLLAEAGVLHVDFLEGDTLLLQQRLGGVAVGAIGRRVDGDLWLCCHHGVKYEALRVQGQGRSSGGSPAPHPPASAPGAGLSRGPGGAHVIDQQHRPARRPTPWPPAGAGRRP